LPRRQEGDHGTELRPDAVAAKGIPAAPSAATSSRLRPVRLGGFGI